MVKTITLRLILLIPVVLGLIRLKKLDKASKFIVLLVSINLVAEIFAAWGAYKFRQSNIAYNIHGPIDLFIISLYFNTIIEDFRKRNIGIIIGALGWVIAIVNAIFFQSYKHLNTNFLAFQSVLVVFMCLYYYFDFLKKDTFTKRLPMHFWFTAILLTYWSFTLFHWVVGLSIMYTDSSISNFPSYFIFAINALAAIAYASVLYNYNKFATNEWH